MSSTRWLLPILAVLGACSSERVVERRDCERLREHLIEIRLAGITTDAEAHRATLRASLRDDFVDRCLESSIDDVECRLAAASWDELAACTANSSTGDHQ
jgi:hypothetical protein